MVTLLLRWTALYSQCSKSAISIFTWKSTESQLHITGRIHSCVYLLNVNEVLRKTLLTPGCHFGKHTPTLTILRSHFTLFHTLTQSHQSFVPFFASIIPFLSIITTFLLCLQGREYLQLVQICLHSSAKCKWKLDRWKCLVHSVVWPLLCVFWRY